MTRSIGRHARACLFWGLMLICGGMLASCGGGGSTPDQTAQLQARKLEAIFQYTTGPLSAPAGQPFFLKTVIGDLDGDGRNDVATFTNWTVNGSDVVVLYQDQSGMFTAFSSFNSISDLGLDAVNDIAVGDLNGDGLVDLAILGNPLPQTTGFGAPLVVLYQDSAGNLGPPVAYNVPHGLRLAIGDLNSDGRNDVVINTTLATIILQGSDGSLGTAPGSVFSVNTGPSFLGEVHIADMDADGDNDLVFQSGDKTVGILRQVAPGIFSNAPEFYQVVTSYWTSFNTFAVGDVNGDGKNDVVVLDPGNNGLMNIFLQNSSGTLDVQKLIIITSSPLYGIEISDVNKDGLNDILGEVVDAGSPTGVGQVHVFYQKADHTFQNPTVYIFPTSAGGGSQSHQSLSIGDVTGDGWPDAVVSWIDEGIFVLRNAPQ